MNKTKKSIRDYIDEHHIELLDVKDKKRKAGFRKKCVGVLACIMLVTLILNANHIYAVTKELLYYVFNGTIIHEDKVSDYYLLENPMIKDNYTIEIFYKYRDTIYYRIKHKKDFNMDIMLLNEQGQSLEEQEHTILGEICTETTSEAPDTIEETMTTEGYYVQVKNTKKFTLQINGELVKINLVKPSPIKDIMTFDGTDYTINFIPLSTDYKNFALTIDGFKKYDHIDYELRGIYLIDTNGKEHLAIPKGNRGNDFELLEPTDEEIVGIRGGELRKNFPKSFEKEREILLPNPKNGDPITLDELVHIEGLPDIHFWEISNDIEIPEELIEINESAKGRKGLKIVYSIDNGHIAMSTEWSNGSGGYPQDNKRVKLLYITDGLDIPNEDYLKFNIYNIHTSEELSFNILLP